ncbi:hypothetical protein NHG34_06010 [Aerococcaceae bacterium NML190938]|nr:hypothetical protein [Aerococcaceae bacterium NML190938]
MIIHNPSFIKAMRKQFLYMSYSFSIFEMIVIPCYVPFALLYGLMASGVPEQYFLSAMLSVPPIVVVIVIVMTYLAVTIGKLLGSAGRLVIYAIKRKRTPVSKRIKGIRFTDKLECIGDDEENFYSYHDLSRIIISGGTIVFLLKRKLLFMLDPSEFTDFTVEDIIQLIQTHNPAIEVLHSGKFWRKTLFF